jgi:hypothetical protein
MNGFLPYKQKKSRKTLLFGAEVYILGLKKRRRENGEFSKGK